MKTNYLPFLTRLRNIEFPVAYESICAQFEDEVFEAENVQQSFDVAKDYLSEVRKLKNMRLQHPLTETISQLTKERHQYLLSLRGQVTYLLKSPFDVERTAAKTLDTWLYGYRDDFVNPSIKAQSGIVDNMSASLKENATLSEAIAELDLVSTLNSLKLSTAEIKQANKIRLDDRKAMLLKASTIREAAYIKMKTFRKSIEVEIELETVDVSKYISYLDNINWAMVDFRSSYLSKTTRTRNAALKAEEEKDTEETSGPLNSTSDNRVTDDELSTVTFNNMNLHKNATKNESSTNKEMLDNAAIDGDMLRTSIQMSDNAIKAHNSATNGSNIEPEK